MHRVLEKNCLNFMIMPIDLVILDKTTFMRGFHTEGILMDNDPKKLSMFNSLYGTIMNADGEIFFLKG